MEEINNNPIRFETNPYHNRIKGSQNIGNHRGKANRQL